jgi:crossover junction endodeoxyribonuclease RusA
MTDELLATFTIWGDPLPKGRPRFGKGRAYTPARTRAYETAVVDAFELACPLWEPVIDHIRVEADFHRATKRRVDVDNLAKSLTDALNGVAYDDDEQIAELSVARSYGAKDNARTEVRLYLLGDT